MKICKIAVENGMKCIKCCMHCDKQITCKNACEKLIGYCSEKDVKQTSITIPFILGEKVWIWENYPIHHEKEVVVGYDHLGPIGGIETTITDNWQPTEHKFYWGLLDKYPINEIFENKRLCRKFGESVMKDRKRKVNFNGRREKF